MQEFEKRLQEMMERTKQFREECGDEVNLAIPMYEDPTRYPVQELIGLYQIQERMMSAQTSGERATIKAEFSAARKKIRLLPDAPERIYLWPEGNIPTQTEYTDNPGYRNDHEPDFKPYMLEMLLPDTITPIGAVITIAGGTHGPGTIFECYQTGLEFNALGYQCFILQCRPNHGPWNEYECGVDAARCLRLIRANAEKYRVDPNKIAMAGFSNGGVTTDFCIEHYSGEQKVASYFPDYIPDSLDDLPGAPDAYLCIYGVRHIGTPYDMTGTVYPPTFIAVGRADTTCMANLNNFIPWLVEHEIPHEIHTFAGHPHGFAGWKIVDGKGYPNFDLWVTHADAFLRDLFQ